MYKQASSCGLEGAAHLAATGRQGLLGGGRHQLWCDHCQRALRGWASLPVRPQTLSHCQLSLPLLLLPPASRIFSSRGGRGMAWHGPSGLEECSDKGCSWDSSLLASLFSLPWATTHGTPLPCRPGHPPSTDGPAPGPRATELRGASQGHPQTQMEQALQGRHW